MRNLSVIIIYLIFTAISCDQAATHEFYVQNHCEESITVDVVDYKGNFLSIEILQNREQLIYSGEIINNVYEDEITYFIKEMNIEKDNIKTNINPLDYRIWRFEKESRLKAKSYLTINPEDFE
jgi:hypothetical protein